MSLTKLAAKVVMSAAALGLVACGGPVGGPSNNSSSTGTPDGEKKNRNFSGKGDQWNWANDPARFQTDLVKNWSELKQEAGTEGYTDNEVWPDTYWPTYKDSINQRWQGEDTLSPVEKYDKAFNDWQPEGGFEDFMNLQPFDTNSCEWDEEYYDKLGPAASLTSKDGNWRAHNGRDDDGDGVPDKEECGWGSDKDFDGVETWWGLCHAWVPAAILEEEPKEPVTVEGANGDDVTFEVADIKALLVEKYDRSDAYMVGGRCNSSDVERDDTGRIPDGDCQDVNPGSFHVLITNLLGIQGRPLAEDRTYDYEVWNQPIIGYKITKQEEITRDKVKELVAGDEIDENAQPETEEEKTQTLKVANTLSLEELTDEAGLRSEKANAIVDYRDNNSDFSDVSKLEEEIGARSVARLLTYAYDQGWLQRDESIYDFDHDADRFVEVEMSVDYVTESHASTEPRFPEIERFTRTDDYHYILELDEDGEITGGEWVGRSMENHPDFLWLPTGPGGGNRHIDLAKVRDLLAKSTSESVARSSF